MCATYYIAVDEHEMAEIIEAVKKNSQNITINTGDIYPKYIAPVFAQGKESAILLPMYWGFPLSGKKGVNFNARSENLSRIPIFRKAMPAVIPTSGFYEWREEDGKKRKYMFNALDSDITFIAGLCSDFAYLEDGILPMRFTMLTSPPSEMFARYHGREPVVLDWEECSHWLETKDPQILFGKHQELSAKPT